ncbi:MAG: uncharacterized protein KVP18_002303 [Porospora cf. gigantea A]|uniref:uncharacterized protein n=2 Tax=Porospora cf. gigantea A TaxID=2853593 RepID=UPI0035595ADC|nr:MAG: hypothetical protein KVP18_002303 [Porospora cf. gigantea A]
MKSPLLAEDTADRTWRCTVDEFFCISARGSTISREVRAGFVLFGAASYILVVNAEVLKLASLSESTVITGTAITGFVSSVLAGLVANLPIHIAPGMGPNTMFAMETINGCGFTEKEAQACAFGAAVLMLCLSAFGFPARLVRYVPVSLKKGVVVGIGLFQTIVGFHMMGLISAGNESLLRFGSLNRTSIVALASLFTMTLCVCASIRGGVLFGLAVGIVAAYFTGDLQPFPTFSAVSKMKFGEIDFGPLLSLSTCAFCQLFTIFAVIFMDTGGVIIGVAAEAPELLTPSGDVVNAKRAWIVLALSMIVASLTGTSPPVIFIESVAAVNAGGRTGLTVVVSGTLFGLAVFCVPLISVIPQCVAASVLPFVGYLMMGGVLGIQWDNMQEAFPAFFTMTMIAFTNSIGVGILAGILSWMAVNAPLLLLERMGLVSSEPSQHPGETTLAKRLRLEKEATEEVRTVRHRSGEGSLTGWF